MKISDQKENSSTTAEGADQTRRATLRRLGRFAAISAPAVTLLLSATTKPASAISSLPPISSRQFKEPVSVSQLQRMA